jgi:hypothetical protein
MTDVAALVAGATLRPAVGNLQELYDTYRRSVRRSAAEARRIAAELEGAGEGAVLDIAQLYAQPQAWNADRTPAVAFAPILCETVQFEREDYGNSYTRASFYWYADQKRHGARPLRGCPVDARAVQDSVTALMGMTVKQFTAEAPVPFVPLALLPSKGFFRKRSDTDGVYVLFDTAVWQNQATQIVMVDPYLLKAVDKEHKRFRVLAHWDLTDKERQLMALVRQ